MTDLPPLLGPGSLVATDCQRCGATLVKPDTSSEPYPMFQPTGLRLGEARYTRSTKFCHHPVDWHSQDADSTEWEVSEMIGGLVRGLQPNVVVETGSAWGQTTKIIGQVLRANDHGQCYSLDPEPLRHEYASWYCHHEVCEDWVELIQASSLEFEPPEGYIDFLFCDSLYELRTRELEYFRPWLSNAALVAVHDTAPGHGPSGSSVDLQTMIANVKGYRSIRLHTPRGITLMVPA